MITDQAEGLADAVDRTTRARSIAWLIGALKLVAVAIGITALSIGAYCGVIIYEGNFHAVSPGILYRSAQPDAAELQLAARQYGIKSVLNLRGPNAGSPWYDDEVGASHALGLKHYDYAISAKRFVTRRQVADIVNILRQAPKPLLIHCMSGADRAGLVAALYRYAVDGASAQQADEQLSLAYGHFPYLTSRSGAMDASFWGYVGGPAHAASE